MTARIAAWRVADWHGDEWQELRKTIDEDGLEYLVCRNDEGAEEGAFCEGEVRMTDGRVVKFSVEKSVEVRYSLDFEATT